MKTFEKLYERAAARKGGPDALEALIPGPKSRAGLRRVPDDRWLSTMTRSVFQAGFSWKVVDRKWPGFEEAYRGFDPALLAGQSDDDLDRLMKDTRIIRHWRKVKATRHNARFVLDLAEEHGRAAHFFADYPGDDFIGLLSVLKKRGAWLGGTTAQYFLRSMGKESFILSRDVVAALRREKVFDGSESTRASLKSIQGAFNRWVAEGGQNLTRVSRVLAFTVGA